MNSLFTSFWFVQLVEISKLTDLVGSPPTGKTGQNVVPSGKLYSNFCLHRKRNKQILTAKYHVILSIPSAIVDFNQGISTPMSFSPLSFYPEWLKKSVERGA